MAASAAQLVSALSLLACVLVSPGKHAPERQMEQPIAVGNESEAAAAKECQKLTLRSNTCQAQAELGTYKVRVDIPGDHPVYQVVGGGTAPYLFYHEEFRNWRIGYDYKKPKAVLTSSTTKTFRSPVDVHAWFQVGEADGKTWERVHDMTVEEVCDDMAAAGEKARSDEMATVASDRALGLPKSKAEQHPYEDVGAGACRDVDGERTGTASYHYAAASDADEDLCQAHCDAVVGCTAYNAYLGQMCVLWAVGDRLEAPAGHWTFVEGAGAADAAREHGPNPSTATGGPLADLMNQPTRCMLKLAMGGGGIASARLRLILLAAALLTAAAALVVWMRQKSGTQDGGAASRVPPSDGAGGGDEGVHSALPKEPLEAEGDEGDDAQTAQAQQQ